MASLDSLSCDFIRIGIVCEDIKEFGSLRVQIIGKARSNPHHNITMIFGFQVDKVGIIRIEVTPLLLFQRIGLTGTPITEVNGHFKTLKFFE